MKADLLRENFLDFFQSNKHRIIDSDSLVPKDDPTVLFTPAGMNQFKKEFLSKRPRFKCVASCQRCLRTDDLDKVGRTPGHHTFFEMLGNFSFGDYFKKEAISFAWEFLTQVLKINEKRLWVSVYTDDAEADKIWKEQIRIPTSKIIKLGDKENFWPSEAKLKGPNGPCGPCSEIFFDQGNNFGCGKLDCNPSCGCGRFVEAWNLVFTQFNREETGLLKPLSKKNIDTGMGLERLAAIMQGAENNFETDLFKPIVKEIINAIKAYDPKDKGQVYAIADHSRAITFAIYDGVIPSNETRGYVVRKLIRKSTLHLRTLGFKKPFLYRLVPLISEIMNTPYPELKKQRENISEVILAEERGFSKTLDSSEDIFREKFAEDGLRKDPVKTGVIAFQLYDTYGIPLELTKEWLDKQGIEISQAAFNRELEEQKNRSKSQSQIKAGVFDIKDLDLDIKKTTFLGYKNYESTAKILKIIKAGIEADKINKGDAARIILDKTVFYPESGGQIGDSGQLLKGKNILEVLDTKKIDNAIIHIGKVKEGSFKKSDTLLAKIDILRRLNIARNHTATHLLQAALRKVLGAHVKQQGSLVAEERLRFDFTHFKNMSKDELNRAEEIVNSYIISNFSLKAKQMLLAEAKRQGALAFFGEKYENKVRVVSISDFSKELCGGTHLASTGSIGIFKIIEEGAVASGIRRIEAQTGSFAYKTTKDEERILELLASNLVTSKDKIVVEIQKRQQRIKELEKQLNTLRLEALDIDNLIKNAEDVSGIKVIAYKIKDADMDFLRRSVGLIEERLTTNCVIISGAEENNAALLVMAVTPDLIQKGIDASRLIKEVASEIGGSGGGRKDFAQAGGSKPENLQKAFKKLKDLLKKD